VAEIVDAEDGFLFARIVGLDRDGDVFFVVVSTAGNEVAGWTGGTLWSLADAVIASPMIRSGSARTTLIVLDCII